MDIYCQHSAPLRPALPQNGSRSSYVSNPSTKQQSAAAVLLSDLNSIIDLLNGRV